MSLALFACNAREEQPLVQKEVKTIQEVPVSEFESDEWRKKDSVAMEYIYMANEYESQRKYKEALVLYKHVCELDHSLPDVCIYTSHLCRNQGDTVSERKYLLKEIKRDKYFVEKHHPRNHEFKMALLQSFYQLGKIDSLKYYARKYDIDYNERSIRVQMIYAGKIIVEEKPKHCSAPEF